MLDHRILIFATSCWCSVLSLPQYNYRDYPLTNPFNTGYLPHNPRNSKNIFRSPLILPDMPLPRHVRVDDHLKPPKYDSYDYFLPVLDYAKLDPQTEYLKQMNPPKVPTEPNYFAVKPKKVPKKYSARIKQIYLDPSHQSSEEQGDEEKFYDENYFSGEHVILPDVVPKDYQEEPTIQQNKNKKAVSNRKGFNANSGRQTYRTSSEEEEEDGDEDCEVEDSKEVSAEQHSAPEEQSDRIEYQIHNHEGPKSYKFGYDTGKGKDRQFRFEKRDSKGHVTGEYGYRNKQGKLILVKYSSSPERGFQVENHH